MPIGTVIIWPLLTMPTGSESGKWLECNGQHVNPSLYPELAALMTNTPDYRGVFLRGYGSVVSMHYGTVTHSSGSLNMLQGDSIRNISGEFVGARVASGGSVTSLFKSMENLWAYAHLGDKTYQDHVQYEFNASYVVPTDNENRPINKAVNYIIRAK